MIQIGKKYRFIPEDDCAGAPRKARGNVVTVLDTFDCLDCWWVRCNDSGAEFYVHGDELEAIPDGSPVMDDLTDSSAPFGEGEIVEAMCGGLRIHRGHFYMVQEINPNGYVIVRHFNAVTNAWEMVFGKFAINCFRRR